MPDLTLLFDVPAEVGLSRLTNPDRIDSFPLRFHQAVRQGFLDLAKEQPDRFRIIDATQPPEKVIERAMELVSERLGAGQG